MFLPRAALDGKLMCKQMMQAKTRIRAFWREREREREGATSSFLLLAAVPFVPSSFLLLVVRPGAPMPFVPKERIVARIVFLFFFIFRSYVLYKSGPISIFFVHKRCVRSA